MCQPLTVVLTHKWMMAKRKGGAGGWGESQGKKWSDACRCVNEVKRVSWSV